MARQWEDYDFALFDSRYGSAVPVREEPEQAPRENIVELPVKELEKNARPKRHPIRAAAAVLSFAFFMTLAVAMVYSQQQLAVLTEQVNAASQTLEESRSLEVQLNMQAAEKMNAAQVEDYAVKNLGMTKITGGQVTYVNVARQDKGTVVQSLEGGSILDKFLSAVRGLFS